MRRPAIRVLLVYTMLMVLGASVGAQSPAAPTGAWVAVYKHDGAGRSIAGDKQALVAAVRRGQSVRVSWGVQHPRDSSRSVEHTALPVFTTVVDGAEVFVQVAEHVAFADYWARDGQAPGNPRETWTGILGTTGTFNALWYNRATGTEVRRLPQRVTMTWFVQGNGAPARSEDAPPLYSTKPVLPKPAG
jgi:hypothetical protein